MAESDVPEIELIIKASTIDGRRKGACIFCQVRSYAFLSPFLYNLYYIIFYMIHIIISLFSLYVCYICSQALEMAEVWKPGMILKCKYNLELITFAQIWTNLVENPWRKPLQILAHYISLIFGYVIAGKNSNSFCGLTFCKSA